MTGLKIVNGAVTAEKLAPPGAAVANVGYTPADAANTWTKDNFNPQRLHLHGIQTIQSEDGQTGKSFRCQDDSFEILNGLGTAVIFRVQNEGIVSPNGWLHLNNPNDGSTRSVHHNDGTIGFVGQDHAWKLRVQADGNVWTPLFGHFNNAFAPRSTMTLHGLGSVTLTPLYGAQPGQVHAIHGIPGAWLLLARLGRPSILPLSWPGLAYPDSS